jgi:hypothetical protein
VPNTRPPSLLGEGGKGEEAGRAGKMYRFIELIQWCDLELLRNTYTHNNKYYIFAATIF